MAVTTARLTKRNFDQPDEIRPFEARGHLDVIELGGTIGRGVFEPGWRWSTDVKPIAGTDSCMAAHAGYVLSGSIHVVMDNGDETTYGPGDVMLCPPGHDAWTVGDEACIVIDWTGYTDYAKRT